MSYFYDKNEYKIKKEKHKIMIDTAILILVIIGFALLISASSSEIGNKEKIYTFNIVEKIGEKETETYVKLDDITKHKEFNSIVLDTVELNGTEYVNIPTIENAAKEIINTSNTGKSNQKTIISEINYANKTVEIYQAVYKYGYSIKVLFAVFSLVAFAVLI